MNDTRLADVSVVITVLNDLRGMRLTIESLTNQTRLPREIVVVDGGSSDGTLEWLQSLPPHAGSRVTVISRPGASISHGRNLAIEAANYDSILVTDSGVTLNDTWVESLACVLASGADVACGFFAPATGQGFSSILGRIITPTLGELSHQAFLPSSRSVAFRRECWRAAGGYPIWLDYCEDLVFDGELLKLSYRFEYVPAAVAEWDARPNLRAFARQYYRYARGDGRAGLYAKRHALRYGAYLTGVVALRYSNNMGRALLAVGFVAYLSKYLRRVVSGRQTIPQAVIRTVACVPVVVVLGDLAKMAGYPAGLLRRCRAKRTDQARR